MRSTLLEISVYPKARHNIIEKVDDKKLKVYVKPTPEQEKANLAVTKLIAKN